MTTGRMLLSTVFATMNMAGNIGAAVFPLLVPPLVKGTEDWNAVLLLAYVATGKGDKVGLLTFADDVSRYLGPRQGRGQFYRMLELLYAVEAQPVEPDYAERREREVPANRYRIVAL